MSERKFKQVGTRPIRHDGLDKVTGRATFGADYELPGMLEGAVLRSPHAHARIVRIDTSKAESFEGVKAVITGADLPDIPCKWVQGGEVGADFGEMAHNIIARDRVLYNGHPVAAVAAKTLEGARRACELIEVEYERLEPVLDLDQALAPDAPILHPDQKPMGAAPLPEGPTNIAMRTVFAGGDLKQGFAEADVVLEREFRTCMVHQGYIEPHACVARAGEDGKIVLWCSTQGPFMVQDTCAQMLGIEASRIKVIPSEIGGGFGGKIPLYLEPLAIVLSRKTGKPVKMVMTREEVFRATGPTSGSKMWVKLGAKRDGTLVAAEAKLWYEAGAYRGSPVALGCMTMFGSYVIPNFSVEGYDVVVNKPKVAAYRAPGAPIAAFAMESCVDELVRELGAEPIELRLLNAVKEGDRAPYGPKFDVIGFRETLEAAKNHPHYKAPLGPNQGRGVASGFWFNVGMQSSAIVGINANGSVFVRTGNPDIGGSRASMALMAAEELGISVEQVTPSVGDTESSGYTDLTGGSRTTFATGMAVIEAARDVVAELRKRAATIWNVDVDQVRWEEGSAVRTNGSDAGETLTFGEIAAKLGQTGGPVVGRGAVNPPAAGPGFTTHLCDVEVDPETGRTEVLRYTAIQDVGKAVHPSYVEGQLQGGSAQGIGWALNEEYIWDADGEVENPGFLDYRMPVASDLPMIDTVLIEVPNPIHPYGVRGVGESPIVPPLAAVANAMRSATGVRFQELPMSPPRVLEALEKNGG